jgi:hypothetical protein
MRLFVMMFAAGTLAFSEPDASLAEGGHTAPTPSAVTLPLNAWGRDPAFRIEDAYKWIVQATRGGEHAVLDEAGPRSWLSEEWAGLGSPLPEESLVEPLAGGIVRLHLRPYKARGGDKERLLAAFLASARDFRADPSALLGAWRQLGEQLREHPAGRLTAEAWVTLDDRLRSKGYPAMHHSASYEERHRPAYRVLTESGAQALLRASGMEGEATNRMPHRTMPAATGATPDLTFSLPDRRGRATSPEPAS